MDEAFVSASNCLFPHARLARLLIRSSCTKPGLSRKGESRLGVARALQPAFGDNQIRGSSCSTRRPTDVVDTPHSTRLHRSFPRHESLGWLRPIQGLDRWGLCWWQEAPQVIAPPVKQTPYRPRWIPPSGYFRIRAVGTPENNPPEPSRRSKRRAIFGRPSGTPSSFARPDSQGGYPDICLSLLLPILSIQPIEPQAEIHKSSL